MRATSHDPRLLELERLKNVHAERTRVLDEKKRDIEQLLSWVLESDKNQITLALAEAIRLDQTGDPDKQWEGALALYAVPIMFIAIQRPMFSLDQIIELKVRDGYAAAEQELRKVGGKRDWRTIGTICAMVEFRRAIKMLDPRFEGPGQYGWSKNFKSKHDEAQRDYNARMDRIFKLIEPYAGKWPYHIEDRVCRELDQAGDLAVKMQTELQYQPNAGPGRALSKFEGDFVKWLFTYGAVKGEVRRGGLSIPFWFSRKVTERAKRIFESNPDWL